MPPSILVVEDNLQNLELVEFLLAEGGMRVATAAEAEAARAAIAREVPDLVLMDMHLPGTDGLALVGELRADPRTASVPIIALTAHAMRGDRERFLAGGCDGYLAKPISVATFVETVRSFLPGSGREG